MPVTECIILAGGFGTRLRSKVADVPKCMAPVAGKPFIHWVIQHLISQKICSFILSVGYLHQHIINFVGATYPNLDVKYCIEDEPLGTGGAIALAIEKCTSNQILVVNGDTLFENDIEVLCNAHNHSKAACTLGLKPMIEFDRYGSVEINNENKITAFNEKKYISSGLINAGVYLIDVEKFKSLQLPNVFSFEKEFLEKYYQNLAMLGIVNEGYFIDIGIPSDYAKANEDLKLKHP